MDDRRVKGEADRFCSGEWPCEASTAAASLERERNDLRAAGQRLADEVRFLASVFSAAGWGQLHAALFAWDAIESGKET